MEDFFGQTLCIGDKVAFVTNKGVLREAQVVEFAGQAPYRFAKLYTVGRRYTTVRSDQIVRMP